MLAGRWRIPMLALCIPPLLLAIASLPWRREAPPTPPQVTVLALGSGPLLAGAGESAFDVPEGAPIAGFSRRPWGWSSLPPARPVEARAVVLATAGCRVALVSAEILVVPPELARAVAGRLSDLALDGVLVGATHTHAGPGGYWDDALAQAVGIGPFRADMARRIEEGIERSVRSAAAQLGPARAGMATLDASTLVHNRDAGARDGRLTVVRVERPGGEPVAEVVVLGAHATLLGKGNRSIDGDWPGRLMAERPHGLRLFLQGTIGDQSAEMPSPREPSRYARSVSALAARAEVLFPTVAGGGKPGVGTALAYARAEVPLPAFTPGAVPGWLRPAARTLLGGSVPASASVSALRVGPALLVAVPAEPVAAVTAAWRARAGLGGATFVTLADGYVGYAETAERFERREGEAVRAYLGPALADRLGEGAETAAAAIGGR